MPNQIEATTLTGIEQPRGDGIELPRGAGFQPASSIDCAYAAAEALRERGPAVAVITLGALGAVAVADGVRIHVPAFAVNVVDTVGAGDAFCAALAVRHAEGTALADAVRFATAAGAVACTRPGAEPAMPRRLDVEALLAIPESATRQGATS